MSINVVPDINPKNIAREARETIKTFITAPGFRTFFVLCFKPTIDKWKWTLSWDANLPPDERAAMCLALKGMRAGFVVAYENAGISMPEWLQKELGII